MPIICNYFVWNIFLSKRSVKLSKTFFYYRMIKSRMTKPNAKSAAKPSLAKTWKTIGRPSNTLKLRSRSGEKPNAPYARKSFPKDTGSSTRTPKHTLRPNYRKKSTRLEKNLLTYFWHCCFRSTKPPKRSSAISARKSIPRAPGSSTRPPKHTS
mgnify:CR=1 FL=1